MGRKSNLNLQYFKLENPTSLCEALREISNTFDIRDDFILLHGDIVSNLDLKPALEMHYQAKQESKEFQTILTKVFAKIPYSSPLRDP